MLLSRVMNNVRVFRVITEMMVKLLKITEIGFTYYWNGLSVGWHLCSVVIPNLWSFEGIILQHVSAGEILMDFL